MYIMMYSWYHIYYIQIHLCHKLYDAIRTLKNEDNQLLSEFVVRLPNRRSVPEYYNVVSHPIDLLKVQVFTLNPPM